MDILYRIRDWDRHFENNRTRELKHLEWVPIPNRHDGDGYTELMSQGPAAIAYLGAFLLIVEVASKCEPRGTLLRDGARPHNSTTLARVTLSDAEIMSAAMPILCTIGWLEWKDTDGTWITFHPAPSCDPSTAPSCIEWKGMEGNGMKGNGIEEKEEIKQKEGRFAPPTLQEVTSHVKEKNYHFDPDGFFSYYASQGWKKSNGQKITDWKQACVTFEVKQREKGLPLAVTGKKEVLCRDCKQPMTKIETMEGSVCRACRLDHGV